MLLEEEEWYILPLPLPLSLLRGAGAGYCCCGGLGWGRWCGWWLLPNEEGMVCGWCVLCGWVGKGPALLLPLPEWRGGKLGPRNLVLLSFASRERLLRGRKRGDEGTMRKRDLDIVQNWDDMQCVAYIFLHFL